jgi:hypothetical protein
MAQKARFLTAAPLLRSPARMSTRNAPCAEPGRSCLAWTYAIPAPGNIYVTPLRFKLGGRRVLSARFNVETAGSEPKRPGI